MQISGHISAAPRIGLKSAGFCTEIWTENSELKAPMNVTDESRFWESDFYLWTLCLRILTLSTLASY